MSEFDLRERRKSLVTLALLGFLTLCSVVLTWLIPATKGGSMNIVAGIIMIPLIIASIVVHGLGIILGLAGSLSRPYRLWFIWLFVVVSADAVIFLRRISN